MELLGARIFGAIQLQVIGVGVVEINLSAAALAPGHRTEERHTPVLKMRRPLVHVLGGNVQCEVGMGLVPVGLPVVLLEQIDF